MVGYYGGRYEKKDMIALIRRAHAVCPLSAVQSEYAIWWSEPRPKYSLRWKNWESVLYLIVRWDGPFLRE